MALYNNWTDDSALWQVKNGTPGTAQTLAAWDYIESRLAGCDQALANARVDETKEDEMDVSDKRTAYTLKVDWSQQRISAVQMALSGILRIHHHHLVKIAYDNLALYIAPGVDPDEVTTLKFDWPEKQLDAVCSALESSLDHLERDALRARDNLPGPSYDEVVSDQAQVHAALRDIREYRTAAAEARRITAMIARENDMSRENQIRDALRKKGSR